MGIQSVNAVQYLGDSCFFSLQSTLQNNQQQQNLVCFILKTSTVSLSETHSIFNLTVSL